MPDDPNPFHYSIELRDGYVFVGLFGRARAVAEVEAMQHEIDAALAASKTRRLIIDNRNSQPPNPWISASMWTWVSSRAEVSRLATLNNIERIQQRIKRRGARNRVSVKVFADEADAVAWINH